MDQCLCSFFQSINQSINSSENPSENPSKNPTSSSPSENPSENLTSSKAIVCSFLANSISAGFEGEKPRPVGFKSEVENLVSKVNIIREVLNYAEQKPRNKAYADWVSELTLLFVEADNLLDEVTYWKLRSKMKIKSKLGQIVTLPLPTRIKLHQQFDKLTESLDDAIRQGMETGWRPALVTTPVTTHPKFTTKRREQSHVNKRGGEIMGRKNVMEQIVGMLLDSSTLGHDSSNHISIIPIVGRGGMGKTTLAQWVFNYDKVVIYFERRIWADVGGSDGIYEKILKDILASATGSGSVDHHSLEQLENQLLQELNGKLYLLVIDDLWSYDGSELDRLKKLLNRGAKGSKVLVTTSAMSAVGTVEPFELVPFDGEDSWSLFQRYAFESGEAPPEFVEVGKTIISRCLDRPLAIIVVARALYQKGLDEWQSSIDKIPSSPDSVMDLLRFSYESLSPPLKLCFLFCSVFSQDYEFSKHDLIYMWMSRGFLELGTNNDNLEEVGEEYFEALIFRCFLQEVERDAFGNIITCKMHDLIYSLALASKGKKLPLYPSIEPPHPPPSPVSLKQSGLKSSISMLPSRALALNDTLPDHLGDLIHLRYLDLSNNGSLLTLPHSITKLHHLQTLRLNCCVNLKKLPKGIGNLVNLRCLEINRCDQLMYLPVGVGKLSQLRTLDRFMIGVPGSDSAGPSVLGNLNNLRGLKIELSRQWRTFVQEPAKAKSNWRGKGKLTDLKIEWRHGIQDDVHNHSDYDKFLQGIELSDLEVLCIEGYKGKDFPSWAMNRMSECLSKLVTVCIEGCKAAKHLPPFSELEYLRSLTLRYMEEVEYVENDSDDPSPSTGPAIFFPSLEELTLHGLYNLKGWWKEERMKQQQHVKFPRLSKLKVWNCPRLTSMPLFPDAREIDFRNVNQKLLEGPVSVSKDLPSSSKSLPNKILQDAQKLETLLMKGCLSTVTLPIIGDGSGSSSILKVLKLHNFDALASLAQGLQNLTSLEELELSGCKKLNVGDETDGNNCPWSSLTGLRYLTFRGIPNMDALPKGLQQMKALNFLWIETCNGLKELPKWIDQLTSLRFLKIEGCQNLTVLPQEVGTLGLRKLEIIECPILMERCKRPYGEYWPYICNFRVLLHKSWRYDLMNETERIPMSAPAKSQSEVYLVQKIM